MMASETAKAIRSAQPDLPEKGNNALKA